MALTYPVQKFIEDNVVLLEENDLTLFFYNAFFTLTNQHSTELAHAIKDVLNIDIEPAIREALIDWAKDNVALHHRKSVSVSKLLQNVPRFGYDFMSFRNMFLDAAKVAYPNKVLRPDAYGIEYLVERT